MRTIHNGKATVLLMEPFMIGLEEKRTNLKFVKCVEPKNHKNWLTFQEIINET